LELGVDVKARDVDKRAARQVSFFKNLEMFLKVFKA
jgi:hypothetical protein